MGRSVQYQDHNVCVYNITVKKYQAHEACMIGLLTISLGLVLIFSYYTVVFILPMLEKYFVGDC